MDCHDMQAAPVPPEHERQWVERHQRHGSKPERGGRFASIETALLFDGALQRRLHAEARRFAVCLSSRLRGRLSLVEASEADIVRWGVDARETIKSARCVYRQPWGVLISQLEDWKLVTDLQRRPYAKRQIHLRLTPVFTNRRQAKPLERPTEILKEERIPTVVVPSRYFDGPAVGELTAEAFFAFMCVHALTDLLAWGGVDPAHLRVENGHFLVSHDLREVLCLDAGQLLEIVLDLEQRGHITFVPVELREVVLPSASSTYEWLSDDPASRVFVVRPTAVPGKATTALDKRQWPDDQVRVLPCTVEAAADRARVKVHELVDVPQYTPGSNVVSDRIGASMKSQIGKAATELALTRVNVDVDIWDKSQRGLVHVYKLVSDALKQQVFTDDSNFVIESIDIRRGEPDVEERPYIRAEVQGVGATKADYSRKIYVRPVEWRPDAQRRTSPLSAWSTYSDYVRSLEATVQAIEPPSVEPEDLSPKKYELRVHVEAPKGKRFDPDNVALFGCDLLTLWLRSRGKCPAVDSVVERVLITHGIGEPSVTLELQPLKLGRLQLSS